MEGPQPVVCVRCNAPLWSVGNRTFGLWPEDCPVTGRNGMTVDWVRLEYCVCPTCGHVEFFVPEVGDRSANPRAIAPEPPPVVTRSQGEDAVADPQGSMEDTWMCSCGECNYVSYEKCLGCGQPRI